MKLKNFLINTIIFVLLLAGSLLVGWHFIHADIMNYFTQVEIVPERFEYNRIYTEESAEFDWDAVTHMEFFDLLGYMDYVDLVNPIGELFLPSIDVRLPILQGSTDLNMTLGAGTVRPGMVMGVGNFVLGSHNAPDTATRFGGLHLLEIGDLIILRDADYLYIYEIMIANYIVHQTHVDIADDVPGKVYVTLFTCTDVVNSDYRIVVRGEFVEQISIVELQASADLLAEFETMSPTINVEIIRVVIENLDDAEIPFPTSSVVLVVGGSIIIATGITWLSGKGGQKNDQKINKTRS